MKRRYDLFLKDMLDAVERIEEYTERLDIEDFKENRLVLDAVIRNLEIIGEGVGCIPKEMQEDHPEVPWKKVRDFRNNVVHRYWTVDVDILWDIIENKLDPFKGQILKILDDLEKQAEAEKEAESKERVEGE